MYKMDSELHCAKLAALRPTQMSVGLRAVEHKRRRWNPPDVPAHERRHPAHVFPAVTGPNGGHYLLDGHHTALALLKDGLEEVRIALVEELAFLPADDFWAYLDHRAWMHCYDAEGRRRNFDAMPERLDELEDDPYRSLASAVLNAGGFSKPDEPFYEFLWAHHFRLRYPRERLEGNAFEPAAAEATELARSRDCRHLPGWAGRG